MTLRKELNEANAGRDPQRLRLKYAKMRADAFTFLRGAPAVFYRHVRLPKALLRAPRVWICGDLHLENFGAFLGRNRLVYFDVNDFDEATLAPCAWDLLRLLTSVQIADDLSGAAERDRRIHSDLLLASYRRTLSAGRALWVERKVARGEIRKLLKVAASRDQGDLLRERAKRVDTRNWRLRLDGRHALPLHDGDEPRVRALLKAFSAQRGEARELRLIHAARRIAGVSSLGLERYVAIVRSAGGDPLLLDMKAAINPTLSLQHQSAMPAWRTAAERVVAVQQLLQAAPPEPLAAVALADHSFIIRELQPQQDQIGVSKILRSRSGLHEFLADIGEVVAWSHLRGAGRWGADTVEDLMAFGTDTRWTPSLERCVRGAAHKMRRTYRRFCRLRWED